MSTVHVVPLRDLVVHDVPGGIDGYDAPGQRWLCIEAIGDTDTPCACHPHVEHVPNDNGPDGWLVTHHSLDGREQHQRSET